MQKEVKVVIAIGIGVLIFAIGGWLWYQQATVLSNSQPVDDTKLMRTDSAIIGKADAPNTIVEFGDYQCPACGLAHPILKKFLTDRPDKVRMVFREFPLPGHKNGFPSSQAALAAGKQGKYTEMHDMLYEKQAEWSELGKPDDKFAEYAAVIGLDVNKFKSDYSDSFTRTRIQADIDDGNSIGVNSTPTLYLNGEKFEGWKWDNLATELEKKLK